MKMMNVSNKIESFLENRKHGKNIPVSLCYSTKIVDVQFLGNNRDVPAEQMSIATDGWIKKNCLSMEIRRNDHLVI